jgi:mannosyltransferase
MKGEKHSKGRIGAVLLTSSVFALLMVFFALGILLRRQEILQRMVLPLASIYAPDGVIEPETAMFIEKLLDRVVPLILLIGLLTFLYGFFWDFLSRRLVVYRTAQTGMAELNPFSTHEKIFIFLGLIIALVIRLHSMGRGLSYDEIYCLINYINNDSIYDLKKSYYFMNNHLANTFLVTAAQKIFGNAEWALRLPSLLLGLTSLYLFLNCSKQFIESKAALLISFSLLALSPTHVEWSVSARGYAGMILCTLVSTTYYFKLLYCPSLRNGLVYTLTTTAGMYFHLFTGLVLATQILFTLVNASYQNLGKTRHPPLDRRSFRILWISFAAIVGLVFIVYMPVLPGVAFFIAYEQNPGIRTFLAPKIIDSLNGGIWAPLGAMMLGAFMWGMIRLRNHFPREAGYFALLFLLSVCLVPLFFSSLSPRFFVFLLPYYILLAVSGLSALWNRRILYAACLALVVSLSAGWTFNSWNNIPEDPFKATASVLETDLTPDIGLCAIGNGAELFAHYTSRTVFVPSSIEELKRFARAHREIRCACVTGWNMSTPHAKILEYLSKKALVHRLRDSVVYVHKTDNNM